MVSNRIYLILAISFFSITKDGHCVYRTEVEGILSSATAFQGGNWEMKASSLTVYRGGDWGITVSSTTSNPGGNWNSVLSSVTVAQSGNWQVTTRLDEAIFLSTLNAPGTVPTLAPGATMFIIDEAANSNVWFDGFAIAFSSTASNGADPFDEAQIGYSVNGSTQLFTPRLVRRLLNDITTDRAGPGFSITSLTTSGNVAIYFSFKETHPVKTPNLQIFVTNLNPVGQATKDLRINAYGANWRK